MHRRRERPSVRPSVRGERTNDRTNARQPARNTHSKHTFPSSRENKTVRPPRRQPVPGSSRSSPVRPSSVLSPILVVRTYVRTSRGETNNKRTPRPSVGRTNKQHFIIHPSIPSFLPSHKQKKNIFQRSRENKQTNKQKATSLPPFLREENKHSPRALSFSLSHDEQHTQRRSPTRSDPPRLRRTNPPETNQQTRVLSLPVVRPSACLPSSACPSNETRHERWSDTRASPTLLRFDSIPTSVVGTTKQKRPRLLFFCTPSFFSPPPSYTALLGWLPPQPAAPTLNPPAYMYTRPSPPPY
mmetsp:Transcript_28204/g.90898  ORF Transcript_28204/g.90898 Transcript_28204/m.90898 type:complete len:299 (+) Transcript_28204:909-1805(+)